ncbi:alpha/beta hydrolase [Sphingomonas sp. AOB5]|uniref:esterase/lipase family protein n=1 Tax=Sphingomonas sp. AOB5 TaxID=3034017 RepID=UPI0023F9BD89|nr:alpha/beta fold hydrolase [Sphingomonas sp. AOB5]MDF7775840.1 alpha/beta hydrolase [Sphingomonas sp. AOB5]
MAVTVRDETHAPSPLAWMLEPARAAWNVAELMLAQEQLKAAPRGDGRPVLLLPGLFNSDRSNFVMRGFLEKLGYRVFGWELGRNFGVRAVGPEAERLIARIEAIRDETGEKVTLIGVSLGGIMARLVAHRRGDLVREVITVSSPYAGPPTATNVWKAFELITGEKIGDDQVKARSAEAAAPLPIPTTAIWSRSDGLVNGMICRDDNCRAIEITSSHMGVQLKPETLLAIADVLAGTKA